MVLSQKQQSELKIDTSKYMVLNIEHFQFGEDSQKFEGAVNLLNCINTIHWINQATLELNSEYIDTAVFYKYLNSIFTKESLQDADIANVFTQIKKIERFCKAMSKIVDTSMSYQGYQIPFEVLMAAQGLNFELQSKLEKKTLGELHDKYGEIYSDIVFGDLQIEDYILRTKELFNPFITH